MIDQDASGEIDAAEAMDALACMVEYEMIDPEDVEGAIGEFVEAAGSDLKLDKKEALINKLKQEFEQNAIPESVDLPDMKFTKAL